MIEAGDDGSVANAPATWVQLVREERWTPAAAAIDALPDAERNKPEVRFARAAVAFARSDAKATVTALESLEGALSRARRPRSRRLRARAQVIAGPYVDAGEWLEKHAASKRRSHRGSERVHEREAADARDRASRARVIGAITRSHAQEMEARAMRMHTGEARTSSSTRGGSSFMATPRTRRTPKQSSRKKIRSIRSTQKELLARAQALADAAQPDDAIHALERARTSRRKPPRR